MRAPLSWLRDFAPLDASVDELTTTLSNLGLVVEGVERVGEQLGGVVVAKVLDQRRHPDADRIRLVDVDAGTGDALQIVCGATNLQAGDLVPLATVGTQLPGGMEIARRKMRGQWSEGMLCAADELDLPATDGERGILVLPPGVAELGTPLIDVDALGVQPDTVFDLEISPNRPDALSMAGVARDLAAALGLPFSIPDMPGPAGVGSGPGARAVDGSWSGLVAPLRVDAPQLCPRLTGTVVRGVAHRSSPLWLARRIFLAGMRPISLVVDATNYVMLDLGQPVHAYDLDRLGGGGLLVRRGRAGETIVTLDGIARPLGPEDCVIADAEGVAVGIGGIMGGASSEVSEETTTVLLEAAWFNPQAIARTGNRLGLTSEARSRFERGVDPRITLRAVDRFVSLLPDAERGPTADVVSAAHLPVPATIAVRTARVNALLGTDLDDAAVAAYLRPLGFAVTPAEAGRLDVTIPTWRPDTTREVDVVEEVARLHGYGRIERTLPPGVRTGGGLTPYQKRRRQVRDILVGAGLSEAWTTTFLSPDDLEQAEISVAPVEVENPLDQAESVLRPSLLPGLLKAVRRNADRQLADARFFEIGHVFAAVTEAAGTQSPASGPVLPIERERLAVIVAGAGGGGPLAARVWAVLSAGLRLDGTSLQAAPSSGLHRGRSAHVVGPAGERFGEVGEVDAEVASRFGLAGRIGYLELDLEALLASPTRPETAPVVSRFPASDVDLAFVVPGEIAAADVETTLRATGGDLLEAVQLFDVYPLPERGRGARSLAYHLRFRHPERTLTDDDVAVARRAAIDAVVGAHGAELRG